MLSFHVKFVQTDRRTGRQTDGRTGGQQYNNMPPDLSIQGHKNWQRANIFGPGQPAQTVSPHFGRYFLYMHEALFSQIVVQIYGNGN